MSWMLTRPDVETSSPHQVFFIDAQYGWALGGKDALLVTHNGGASWKTQRLDSDCTFDMVFVDRDRGWVVGEKGAILATSDGAATWTRQPSGTREPLYGVFFLNKRRGWAVGRNGTLVSTVNGGRSWRAQRITEGPLNAVCFADRRHGWAVEGAGDSEPGVILHTSDGGLHWDEQESSALDPCAVTAVDARHAWVADAYAIHWTDDRGQRWDEEATIPSVYRINYEYLAVSMADVQRGWALATEEDTQASVVLSTQDGGRHWTPAWRGRDGSDPFFVDLCLLPHGRVVAVGYDPDERAVVLRGTPKSDQ